jgi:L-ornithine Nalpha-acyltransferase
MPISQKLRPSHLVRKFVPLGAFAWGAAGARSAIPESLKRFGSLEVRLARSAREVRLAQALRYRVFYREMQAQAGAAGKLWRRDIDGFDSICDHLLVIDHDPDPGLFRRARAKRKPTVVGTYRLLRQEIADQFGGFYTAGEYEIDDLVERHRPKRFLELGRSCVLKEYRNKRTVELLWAGCWEYVQHHAIDVMIGCASLEGTEPRKLALPLSFLHHHAVPPPEWRVRALPSRYVPMNRMSAESVDTRSALSLLPPLIKGYLRLGAYIGEGAVVDHQFGTTDVCIVLPVSAINPRYIGHFGQPKERLS